MRSPFRLQQEPAASERRPGRGGATTARRPSPSQPRDDRGPIELLGKLRGSRLRCRETHYEDSPPRLRGVFAVIEADGAADRLLGRRRRSAAIAEVNARMRPALRALARDAKRGRAAGALASEAAVWLALRLPMDVVRYIVWLAIWRDFDEA